MPNLERHAVTDWLADWQAGSEPPGWPPPIRPIETMADIPARLVSLGNKLDEAAQSDLRSLSAALRSTPLREDLGAVLAQLGAARVLRLLHWLAEQDVPDCHAVIAGLLHDDGSAGQALRAAVAAVTRRAVMRRIFAPERVAALEAACDAIRQEAA